MHVQRTDKGRSLTAVIVQTKQNESGIILCAEVALHLILVCQNLKFPAGIEEFLGLVAHAVVAQQILEDVEILSLVRACILRTLLQIGEGAPLSLLVANHRRVVRLFALVVSRKLNVFQIIIV